MERLRITAIEISEYDFNCALRSVPRYLWLFLIGLAISALLLIFFLTSENGHTTETKIVVATTSPVINLNATLIKKITKIATTTTPVPVPVLVISTKVPKTITITTTEAQKTIITATAKASATTEDPNGIWNFL